ncbi:MAG: hypothetical protein IPM97_16155 [Bdellovibrionaceae bacterium]|nr:hypothetical protein [Pseudobdellovibrionaceae bacterium]
MTILLTSLVFALNAFASESKILTIEGKIRSFDKDVIRITTAKGVVEVPRKFVPSKVQLKTDENIKIPLTEDQLSLVK